MKKVSFIKIVYFFLVIVFQVSGRCEQYMFSTTLAPDILLNTSSYHVVLIPNPNQFLSFMWTVKSNSTFGFKVLGNGEELMFYPFLNSPSVGRMDLPYDYDNYEVVFFNPSKTDYLFLDTKMIFMEDVVCRFEYTYHNILPKEDLKWCFNLYSYTNDFKLKIIEKHKPSRNFNFRFYDYMNRKFGSYNNISYIHDLSIPIDVNSQYYLCIEKVSSSVLDQQQLSEKYELDVDIQITFNFWVLSIKRDIDYKIMEEDVKFGESSTIPFDEDSNFLLWSFEMSNNADFLVQRTDPNTRRIEDIHHEKMTPGMNKGGLILENDNSNSRTLNISNHATDPTVNVFGKFLISREIKYSIKLPVIEIELTYPEYSFDYDLFLQLTKYEIHLNVSSSSSRICVTEFKNGEKSKVYNDLEGRNTISNKLNPSRDDVVIRIERYVGDIHIYGETDGIKGSGGSGGSNNGTEKIIVQLEVELFVDMTPSNKYAFLIVVVSSAIDFVVLLFLLGDFYFSYCVKRSSEKSLVVEKKVFNNK